MKKNAILAQPETLHTIEDRRALTKDTLKVAEHELRKRFEADMQAAKKKMEAEELASYDACIAYNYAAARCIMDVLPNLKEELEHSFKVINRLERPVNEYCETETEKGLAVETVFGYRENFLPMADAKAFGRFVKEFPMLSVKSGSNSLPCINNMSGFGADEDGNLAHDLDTEFSIEIYDQDNDEGLMSAVRRMEITCTPALQTAREAIQARLERLEACLESLNEAKKKLGSLPTLISELDISATVLRVRDAGGADFIDNIMAGVDKILAGETNLSGVMLALEEPK